MGNVEAHDFAPVRADERNLLNLGRKVTPKQYVRHLNGQPHEACLTELPWNIRDSVCLYERMTVAFNAITEIPVELPLRLPHLSCLHLNHNQIAALPESFGLFFHLKEIQLQHNKLAALPDSFVHLVKLEKIDLSYNELRSLPQDMGSMESLKKLNVIHNKLVELPVSLGSPSCAISVLLAQQNRLERPSQAICDEGSQSTLQCLRKMHSCIKPEVKPPPVNVFPRCCSNRSESGVSNPHSAQVQYIQEQTNTLHTTNRIKAPLLPPPDASHHSPFVLQDKIIGLIFGAAIGDAIGLSCVWMSEDEVVFHYGNEDEELEYDKIVQDEHRVLWRQGDWTSNFDQFMLVLESLVAWGGVVDELEFARRLKAWVGHGFPELGDSCGVLTSPATLKVISQPSFTEEPHTTASFILQEKTPPVENGGLGIVGERGEISISPNPSNDDSDSNSTSHPSSPIPSSPSPIPSSPSPIPSSPSPIPSSPSSIPNSPSHSSSIHTNIPSSPTRITSNPAHAPTIPAFTPSSPTNSSSTYILSSPAHTPRSPKTNPNHQQPRLRRLSSNSVLVPTLSLCTHMEVAQKLVDATPSACRCPFGEDGLATVRSAILGVPNFHEPQEVEGNTVRICRTTHAHPKCIASCIVVSSIISMLLQGNASDSSSNQSDITHHLQRIFTRAASYLTNDSDKQEFETLKEFTDLDSFYAREPDRMGHCYKLVQIALIALHWKGDFRSLIGHLTRMGGDSSSNACMAGAVMGCRVGYSNLPPRWLAGLRKRQVTWLNARTNHLLDIMGSP